MRALLFSLSLCFLWGGFALAQQAAQPAEPASTPTTPAPVASSVPAPAPAKQGFRPSFGESRVSVLFAAEEAEAMRSVLEKVERVLAVGGTPVPLDIGQRVEEDAQAEGGAPAVPSALLYPAFHLASIVYHSPGDWMLWLNGERVTPKRLPGGVVIGAVGREQVQISWQPDYWEQRLRQWEQTQPLSPQLSRWKAPQGRAWVDKEAMRIGAVLRANQTLVTAVPVVVEGGHPDFAVTVETPAPAVAAEISGAEAAPAMKMAQDYIEKVAGKKSEEVSENTRKAAQETKEQKPAKADKPAASAPALSDNPPAPAEPPPPPDPAVPALPETLDDILDAVTQAQPKP